MNKNYIEPKIKRIELDQKQALLSVCSLTSGKYFFDGNKCLMVFIPTTTPAYCIQSVKGAKDSLASCNQWQTDTMPS
ncbi:MAG: hypothetical protein PHQ52_03170 [Candidatus Omnitrophica bacterium]|nr:hypothetical protein [Candidatus Omnitrophota bacterium]